MGGTIKLTGANFSVRSAVAVMAYWRQPVSADLAPASSSPLREELRKTFCGSRQGGARPSVETHHRQPNAQSAGP
jgi:hypothetical protein